ncbi:uncharacterized protein [Hetaerina americana]|uniref:uncharacterized protein isoform X1 n=1 Tax=Hetaerina americana TaxID=62018 RepID=UPI003A7F326F
MMEKQNTIPPTCLRMKLLKGVAVNKRSAVLNQAAELTSALAEVIAPAFGPNGLAVLFTRESSSANSTGTSPIISRTGLQMMEILVLRNSAKSIHPLLKSLVDSCRILEHEWGDGVKSLVLIASELLRQCSALECVGRPGWLRKELGKALDYLSKSCEFSDICHLYGSTIPADGKQCQEKLSQLTDEEFNVNTMDCEALMKNSSQFISAHYPEVLTLLKMFFNTRFPAHVVEVVPNLLCDWIKSVEKDSRDLNFMVDNFSPLCHVNVGFPMDHCFVLDGVLVQGYGIGYLFTSKSDYFHKETCRHSIHSCGTSGENRQRGNDGCDGCISINVEIITEHEVTSAFEIKQDQFEFKPNCLYVTSCTPSDFIKFKIGQLAYISLIHSVPSDDVDFLRYLMHDQKSSHLTVVDCFFVNWVRAWPASPSRNSGLVWLGVPRVRSLMLSVPVMGMKDGLKRSCQNALSLIHQFSIHFRHRCTENIKLFAPQNAPSSNPSSRGEASNYSLNGGKSQIAAQKCSKPTDSANILPLNPTLCFEKLLPNHMSHTALESVVAAGGLAEIYLHDMVIAWWLTPSNGGGEYIDREVTKAITRAILTVPISLSTKGKLLRYPRQPLTLNFSSKSKELIAHRLRIVQLAVSVAFSLSNISDVMVISKSASRMNLSSSQNLSSDDDDDDD